MRRLSTILLLLLGTVICFGQNSLTVEAPQVVSLGETFRVVFSADGRMSDFNWPGSNDFMVTWGPQQGTMSSTNIINGKRTSIHQETMTYLLEAKAEGTFTIPAATAVIDKKTYSSKSVSIEVVKGEPASQPDAGQTQGDNRVQQPSSTNISNSDIFMKLTINKSNVVKGEPVIATLKLYTRVDIAGFENVKFPTFDGFWSKETDTPQNVEFVRENVGGEIYNAALLRKYMLIPQQSGTLTIEPAEMICQLRVRSSSSSSRSIFDDFFDNYQTVRKRVSTPQVKVNVRNLPAGAPASFAGGVGDFRMSTSFSKDTLNAHEAASLTVTISGKGNISMLEAPKVNFPPDFEVYDIKTTENISSDGTSGSKSFEFPFIPRSHGEFQIEPVKYSFYDISKDKYVEISSGNLRLGVGRGSEDASSGVVMPGIARQSVKNLAEDIRYIITGDANLKKEGSFFAGSGLFYGIIAAVAALFFVISAILKKGIERRRDVIGSKNRKANKMARAKLKLAGDYLKQNLSAAYYEELHKAVLGYVSDKLIIPVADLSKERIREVLCDKGVNNELIDSLLSIVDACEYARYAPDAGHEAMENHYNEAVKVISELDGKVKNNTKNKKVGKVTMVALLIGVGLYSADAQTINDSLGVAEPQAVMPSQSVSDLSSSEQVDGIGGLWKQGNEAYGEGQYNNALNYYQMIEGEKLISPELYYNIGNTYFKMGDNAHSILYYEKALKLDPSYGDALNNLAIAQNFTLDKIEEVPDFILVTWIREVKYLFSADVWAWITVVLAIAAAVLMLGFKFASSAVGRKLSFIFACIVFVVAISTFAFSLSEKSDAQRRSHAIVTVPVSSVKSSPGDAGKSIFVLHEGTKVSLRDDLGEWIKIELSDGRQGWVPANSIEII